jgi:outer membrane protein OmpA-like peptidoglycan-associated protein/tetratricopeptide (TPR) repeat protein/uncharacterized protein YoxC
MKKSLFLAFFVLSATSLVLAQPGKTKYNGSSRLAQAEEMVRKGNFFEAAAAFKTIVEKNGKNTAAHWKLAECAALLHDYRTAAQQYKYVHEQTSAAVRAAYPNAGFFYAKMLKHLGNYETARGVFTRFIDANQMNTDPQTARFIALAKVERDGCDLETGGYTNMKATCDNIGKSLNGAYNEGGASFVANDKMLYAGIKMNTAIDETNKNKAFAKLYEAAQNGTAWGDLQPLAASINAPDMHNAHPALSPDGKRLYFTRSMVVNGKMRAEIYMAKVDNGVYSAPIRLEDDVNMLGTSNTMPFVMNAGRGDDMLYFASTRSGGKGGYDIWRVVRHPEGTYERFENLANINTIADELAPFIDAEGKLFFSSEGHAGFGGLDVFSYEVIEQEPIIKNAGKPINSPADDFGFSTDKTGTNGLFISNRTGATTFDTAYPNASDDIFMVKIDRKKPIKPDPNLIASTDEPIVTETTQRIVDGIEKTTASTKIDGKNAANADVNITINIDNTDNTAKTETTTNKSAIVVPVGNMINENGDLVDVNGKIIPTDKPTNIKNTNGKNEKPTASAPIADNTPIVRDPNAVNSVLRDEVGNFVYSNGNIIDKKGNLLDRKGNIIAKNFDIKNKNGNITDKNGKPIYTPLDNTPVEETAMLAKNENNTTTPDKNDNVLDKNKDIIDENGNIIAKSGEIDNPNAVISTKTTNDVAKTTNDVAKTTNDIAKTTNDIAKTTNDIGKTTNDIGKTTNDIGKTTNDIGKTTNDIGKTTNDIGKTTNDIAKNINDGSTPTRIAGTNYNNKVRNTVSADACAKASLYDVSNGVAKLVKEIPCANENNTDFALAPNKKYIFALEKAGETLQMREVSTLGSRRSEMFRPKLDGREVSAELPKANAIVATNTDMPAPQQGEKFTVKGSLAANEGSANNLAGAQVVLYKMQNETQVTEIARQPLAADNSYSFEVEHGSPYKIVAEKPGYLTVSQEFTANKTAPVLANNEKMVLREKKNNVAYNVKDINYEFGSYALAPEGMQNLDGMIAMLRDNATIIVEISAHTDNIGSPATNLVLSQKRAQSVVDYLVGKGVDKTRLKAQGYGETKPIANNINEAGRLKNRRTEFKLVGEVK